MMEPDSVQEHETIEQNPLDDPEEREVVYRAINSFHRYRDQAHYHVTHKRRQAFYALPQRHSQLLAAPPFDFLSTLEAIDDAIDRNAGIADAFCASGAAMYDLDPPGGHNGYQHAQGEDSNSKPLKPEWQGSLNPLDQEKAHSTVKQLFRDWSHEGAAERKACIDPVIEILDQEFSHVPKAKRGSISVLLPGAGLGRTVFEINRAGYAVEGNEISYHQIIASNFMLNFTSGPAQFELYPWIHGFSNHLSREDQLQKVLIPDVHPATELQRLAAESEIHPFERMSFSSADFCVAYKAADAEESFDAVASIFFIDTAPNVLKYVEAVHHCLKKGGIWINLGPLKWHFENNAPQKGDKKATSISHRSIKPVDEGIGDPGAIELAEDEVISLLTAMGFSVEQHQERHTATGYINNPNSMWESVYHPSLWVARKL